MVLQILYRGRFARGIGQTGLYQLPEHGVLYPVEAHIVKYAVQYQISTIYPKSVIRKYVFPWLCL